MQALSTTEGQRDLPAYFAPVFATACAMEAGRLDIVLPGQESLEAAQTAKHARPVDRIGAEPGDHVLEIGRGTTARRCAAGRTRSTPAGLRSWASGSTSAFSGCGNMRLTSCAATVASGNCDVTRITVERLA